MYTGHRENESGVEPLTAFLRRLPIPAGCVALGLIGLGTLLRPYGLSWLLLFGGLAALLLLLVIAKLCLPGEAKKACGDLTGLSLLAGSSMALMLLAAQGKTALALPGAGLLWGLGLLAHLLLLAAFSRAPIKSRPGLHAVRGCWLLVYVGIAAAAISAPAFSMQTLGRILLIPAALGALVLLPLVYAADRNAADMPPAQRPLFCISAAPVSIWLVGWLSVTASPPKALTAVLTILSVLLYVPALLRCGKGLRGPFYPSYAAYTFPFIISATALKRGFAVLGLGGLWQLLPGLETAVAAALCCWVLLRYARAFLPKR